MVNTVGISHRRVENILHNELGMAKVSTRRLLRLLMPDQKLTSLTLSQANLTIFEEYQASFLDPFLTQDENGFTTLSLQANLTIFEEDQANFLDRFLTQDENGSTTLSQRTKDNQ